VHRAQAVQEIRRKREKLAMDNVRLGKVVSTRGVSVVGARYGPAGQFVVMKRGAAENIYEQMPSVHICVSRVRSALHYGIRGCNH
jgi:hypothetical protein